MLKRVPVVASMLSLATVAVPQTTFQPTRTTAVHSARLQTHSGLKHRAIIKMKPLQKAVQKPVHKPTQEPVHKPHSKWVPMIATWYDGKEGINGTGTGITRSGAHVVSGITIAVDPKLIPLGSHVLVRFSNGTVHTYIAEDTGSDIIGNHIDIYNPSRWQCLKNGVQHVSVEVENR